jgi:hypothetical protein
MVLSKKLNKINFIGNQQIHFIHKNLFSFFLYLRSKSAGYKAFKEKMNFKIKYRF